MRSCHMAEELCREKEALVEHFVRGPGSECGLSSLYFQACRHSRCSHAQAPFELLHGQPHLEEMLGGLRFRISPESFFQSSAKGDANNRGSSTRVHESENGGAIDKRFDNIGGEYRGR
ncbi:hypothetical protein V5799_025157 [Amblyomma americanum]|uniref:Uncharacterized protein n=1 Tax=Amblyomma americanum TaxID=6943 RepID=A0AAQ4EA00_AMBAM